MSYIDDQRPPKMRLLWPLLLSMLVAGACGSDGVSVADRASVPDEETSVAGAQRAAKPTVVVTTDIWADVVENVACNGAINIETLIPPGGDPHGFEPSLADRGRMEDAVLVVANGLSLEEGLEDTLSAVADGGTAVFRMADHVSTIAYSSDQHHDHNDEDHEGDDPHIWFDPQRVSSAMPELADQLIEHASLDRGVVNACVADYQAELAALDSEIADLISGLEPDARKLVTSHDSLGYFAERYNLEIIGTVLPAPSGLAQTNPAQLEELALLIEATDVKAIFAEAQHATDDAEALADRVGDVQIVTLYSGSLGPPGSGADTYLGLLRTNATLIVESLG